MRARIARAEVSPASIWVGQRSGVAKCLADLRALARELSRCFRIARIERPRGPKGLWFTVPVVESTQAERTALAHGKIGQRDCHARMIAHAVRSSLEGSNPLSTILQAHFVPHSGHTESRAIPLRGYPQLRHLLPEPRIRLLAQPRARVKPVAKSATGAPSMIEFARNGSQSGLQGRPVAGG